MADTNEELVGAIGVTITGDYSSLAASYSTAQDQAQEAGEAVASAFNKGVGGVADAAEVVEGSLGGVGNSLAEVAEKMAAVGEALVITEGMKDLGTEALTAADAITHASIALTEITGSASTANDEIEALDALGTSDGLAFPSLLTAGVRMQAILGPGADVTAILAHVADGAAVMGTDIETATTKFDQMATAGTASARTLTSLGLSLGSLATAFNIVEGRSDATASSVAAMFKALDQSQRIDVLTQALSNLGGTAQQVAEQTFGGQWTQLANQWEAIMVQVGQALLPVISDLTALTKTEILPFIQELVKDFSDLPGPVKDGAVAATVFVASLIPITGLVAAAGLGISGLSEVLGLLGINSTTAAAAQHTEAAASVEQGTAAAAAIPEVEGLALASEQLSFGFASELAPAVGLVGEQLTLELVPAIAGVGTGLAAFTTDVGAAGLGLMALGPAAALAVLSAASLKDGWNQAKDTFANVVGTVQQIPAVIQTVTTSSGLLGTAAGELKTAWTGILGVFEQYNTYALVAKGLNEITNAVDVFLGITPRATVMTDAMTQGQQKLQASGEEAAKAQGTLKDSLTPLQTAIHDIVTAQDQAQASYQKALDTYNALSSSLQNGTAIYNGQVATVKEVSDAYAALQKAAAAAGDTLAPIPGSMAAITQAATQMADAGKVVISTDQEMANQQTAAVSSLDLATKAYQSSVVQLDDYVAILKEAQQANNGTVAAEANVTAAEQNVQKAYAASQTGLKGLTDTVQNYVTYMNGSGASTKAQIDLLQDLATKFGPATAAALGLNEQIAALQKQANAPIIGLPDSLAGLQSALTETTKNVAKLAADMAAGQDVGVQYGKALAAQTKAQIDLNVAAAEEATGLQGATDAWSLNTIAVAAAQAKYDTLAEAYKTNITLAPQVEAAQKALTTAQGNLNTVVGDASPLIVAQNTNLQTLINTQNQLPSVVNAATTSLQNQVAAIQTIGQAIQQVESSLASAMGLTDIGKASGSFGPPAGYVANTSITPGVNGGASSVVSFLETPEHAAQRLYAAGYSPQQIVDTIGYPLEDVLKWIGVKPTGSNAGALGGSFGGGLTPTPITGPGLPSGGTSSAGGSTGTLTSDQYQQLYSLEQTVASLENEMETANADQLPLFQQMLATAQQQLSQYEQSVGLSSGAVSPGGGGSVPVTSASGSGTAAVDGGSYPAVTAHQASGEVWSVTTSGASAASGGLSGGSSSSVVSATTASTAATSAVSGAVQSLTATLDRFHPFNPDVNGSDLGPITTGLANVASAVEAVATALGGAVQRLNTSGAVSSAAPATYTGSSGSAYSVGTPTTTVGGGAGNGIIVPIVSPPPENNVPGYNPFGPGATINPNVTINISGGGTNSVQLAAQIQKAVIDGMVQATRTAGARY